MSRQVAPPPTKRQEIADAALRIIGTRGIASLTMAVLAQELGVSPGAPFRHFASRDEILDAVTLRVEELVADSFPDPELPPLRRLEHLFITRTATVGRHAGIARLMFSEQFALALPAPASERLQQLVKRTRATILEALREGVREGSIRQDVPVEDLVTIAIGALQHLVFLDALGAAMARPPRVRKVFEGLKRLLAPVPSGPKEDS